MLVFSCVRKTFPINYLVFPNENCNIVTYSYFDKMKMPETEPFKRQFHKIVKHTQTIRRQIADELFECVRPFCGIDA